MLRGNTVDPFKILGICQTSSLRMIKIADKKLAKVYHQEGWKINKGFALNESVENQRVIEYLYRSKEFQYSLLIFIFLLNNTKYIHISVSVVVTCIGYIHFNIQLLLFHPCPISFLIHIYIK